MAGLCEKYKLDQVEFAVIDEADKLFEMGFYEQLKVVLESLPESASEFLFSATMQPHVEFLVKQHMKDPVKVLIGISNAAASTIEQQVLFVGKEEGKLMTLRQILRVICPF